MTIDMTRLSPAPFTVRHDTATVTDANGGAVAHFFHGSTPETKAQAMRDAESYALMRNAADVMARRGWGVKRLAYEGDGATIFRWVVTDAGGDGLQVQHPQHEQFVSSPEPAEDPFTALVAADAWYREHGENQPADS